MEPALAVHHGHGGIGNEAADEAIQVGQGLAVGSLLEVLGVPLHDQPVVGHPLLELEGAGATGVRAKPSSPSFSWAALRIMGTLVPGRPGSERKPALGP